MATSSSNATGWQCQRGKSAKSSKSEIIRKCLEKSSKTVNFIQFFQASFFRQHNCNTTDTQLKYKSRAAQLYRDKLHGEAAKAMRVHGTKLFISAPQNKDDDENDDFAKKEDEADFFEQHSNAEDNSANIEASQSVSLAKSVAAVSFFTNSPNFDLVFV